MNNAHFELQNENPKPNICVSGATTRYCGHLSPSTIVWCYVAPRQTLRFIRAVRIELGSFQGVRREDQHKQVTIRRHEHPASKNQFNHNCSVSSTDSSPSLSCPTAAWGRALVRPRGPPAWRMGSELRGLEALSHRVAVYPGAAEKTFFDTTRRIIQARSSRQGGGLSDTVPSPKTPC